MPRQPAIPEISFAPGQKPRLGFEIFTLSALRARLRDDPALKAPMRLDFHLVYLGLKKTGSLRVDFEKAPFGAGWLTVVPRGRVHEFTAGSQGVDAWMLLFTPEFVATRTVDASPLPALLSSQMAPGVKLDPIERRELLTLCSLMATEYARPFDAHQPTVLSAMLRALLLRAERLALLEAPALSSELTRFYAVLERDVLTIHDVRHYAKAIGVSPRRLGEWLMAHTGRSTKQVIDERLVLEAKRLLAHTTLSVKELADRTGFSEPTNFVKFFKLHAHETPLGFRARFHHPAAGPHLVGDERRR